MSKKQVCLQHQRKSHVHVYVSETYIKKVLNIGTQYVRMTQTVDKKFRGFPFKTGYFKNNSNNDDLIATVNMYTGKRKCFEDEAVESEHSEIEDPGDDEPSDGESLDSEDSHVDDDDDDDDDTDYVYEKKSFIVSSDDDDDDESDSQPKPQVDGKRSRILRVSSSDDDDDEKFEPSAKKKRVDTDDIVDVYENEFRTTDYGVYRGFTHASDVKTDGIPYLIKHFSNENFKPFDAPTIDYTIADSDAIQTSTIDFIHVQQYLDDGAFNKQVLSDTTTDPIMYAIISFMIRWSVLKLEVFANHYPRHKVLATELIEIRNAQSSTLQIQEFNGEPFLRTTFRVLRKYSDAKYLKNGDVDAQQESKACFYWTDYIKREFIEHLNRVYDLLTNNAFNSTLIDELLNSCMDVPYELPNVDVGAIVKNRDNDPKLNKYLTGEACCCKTTILNKLTKYGWSIYSRSGVGSFSGKATNPVDIGNLHASLHWVHQQPNVLGDRGFIDNIVWSFIMPQCETSRDKTMISDLISFLTKFNEPSIAEYLSHKVIIFIDPYSERLRARQLKRCSDGDALRARIPLYPHAQFITYYAMARLFNWKIITVPYTDSGEIDQELYQANVREILEYFDAPKMNQFSDFVPYARPANLYTIDNTVPRSFGIFK